MKLRHLLLITALAAPAIFTGCGKSQASETQKQEIVFSDGSSSNVEGQDVVVIDDSSLPGGKLAGAAPKSGTTPAVTTGADGSKITVMVDAYGNKSEMRCFNNDSRVKCISIKTAKNGNKNITVFGQNGVTKIIPGDKLGDGLGASADEIAKAAELSEPSQKADIAKMLPKRAEPVKLQPLPSSEFPIQPKQIPQTPVEENQPAESETEPPKSDDQINPELENQNLFQ